MNRPDTSSPRLAANFTSADTWLHLCALPIQALGPLIDATHASEIAIELQSAWPKLDPAHAAESFLQPTPGKSDTQSSVD